MPFPDFPWVGKTVSGVTAGNTPVAQLIAAGLSGVTCVTVANTTNEPVSVKLFDKATAPALGVDVPVHTFNVGAYGSESVLFGAVGLWFTAGVALAMTKLMDSLDASVVQAGTQWTVTHT